MKRFVALMTASALALSSTPVIADGGRIHDRDGPRYDWRVPGKPGRHAQTAHRFDERRFDRHRYDRDRFDRHRGDRHRFDARRDGHRKHRRHKDRDHDDAWLFALGGLAGGLVIGSLLSQPEPAYAAPPPPAYRDCRPTTGIGYLNGHAAEFGGTWCVDAYGRGGVIPGSEYFIGYL